MCLVLLNTLPILQLRIPLTLRYPLLVSEGSRTSSSSKGGGPVTRSIARSYGLSCVRVVAIGVICYLVEFAVAHVLGKTLTNLTVPQAI